MFSSHYFYLAIIVVFFIYFIVFDFSSIRKRNYKITTLKINSSIKICHISDLHSSFFGDKQQEICDLVDIENPDLIIYTGDIYDGKLNKKNAEKLLLELSKNYKSFFINGNHELKKLKEYDFRKFLSKIGVEMLSGSYHYVDIRGETIKIAGLDDEYIGSKNFMKQIRKIKNTDEKVFSIIALHRPCNINKHKDKNYELNYDLVLSGHTHGGQWIVPIINRGLFATGKGLFPKHTGGFFKLNKTSLIVSRGLARDNTFVPRIFNPCEIGFVELSPKII